MSTSNQQPKELGITPLKWKTHEEAIKEALSIIDEERSGHINGLVTRWEGINRAKMRYWRFRSVTLMAGSSGSGKSAILNMLEDDFTNPVLNPTFLLKKNNIEGGYLHDGQIILEPKIILIAFKYEMDAADEVLRNLSGKVEKSYAYLLSSEKKATDTPDFTFESTTYNTVTADEVKLYEQVLEAQKHRPIVYIETPGNLDQMVKTVKAIRDAYPGRRIIVSIDHTLLSLKLSERDDMELMARTARVAITLKKDYNANVILLGQLNAEIEKTIRKDNPNFHFPVKSDIHAQNQVFWACDDVMIWHRPELLGIEKYGKVKMFVEGSDTSHTYPINAAQIVHCNWIKSRKNRTGSIWFLNQFSKGKMIQVHESRIKYVDNMD